MLIFWELLTIKNQKEHHRRVSFEEEYRQFLIENGIEINVIQWKRKKTQPQRRHKLKTCDRWGKL